MVLLLFLASIVITSVICAFFVWLPDLVSLAFVPSQWLLWILGIMVLTWLSGKDS